MNSLAPTIYPSMISRACAALDEATVFTDMRDGFLRVVLRIVKKINLKSPYSPIFAARSTLAAESGRSLETVHRAVKWLEDEALIEREQKARKGLRGSSSPLIPTKKFLDALLLTLPPPAELIASGQQQGPERPSMKRANWVRVGKVSLPADVAWLTTKNGLRATAVLKLMTIAKKAGQRLSDVVSATTKYLIDLKGREVFAYIKSLLSKGRDFGQVVEQAKKEQDASRESEYLKSKAESLDGRSFSNKEGSLKVTVEAGMLMVTKDGRRSAQFMNQSFLDAVEAGRLRERWAGVVCG